MLINPIAFTVQLHCSQNNKTFKDLPKRLFLAFYLDQNPQNYTYSTIQKIHFTYLVTSQIPQKTVGNANCCDFSVIHTTAVSGRPGYSPAIKSQFQFTDESVKTGPGFFNCLTTEWYQHMMASVQSDSEHTSQKTSLVPLLLSNTNYAFA